MGRVKHFAVTLYILLDTRQTAASASVAVSMRCVRTVSLSCSGAHATPGQDVCFWLTCCLRCRISCIHRWTEQNKLLVAAMHCIDAVGSYARDGGFSPEHKRCAQ